jgi:hypothetical protein
MTTTDRYSLISVPSPGSVKAVVRNAAELVSRVTLAKTTSRIESKIETGRAERIWYLRE